MKLQLMISVFLNNDVLMCIDNSDDTEEVSLNEYGIRAIKTLQRHGKHNPMSIDDLSRAIHYDIEANDDFMKSLERNPLIEYDNGTFRFKVSFYIVFSIIA